MDNPAEEIFSRLRGHLSDYAGLKIRLFKLIAIEGTARFMAVLSHGIVLILLTLLSACFLFIALGLYLGELLGNTALGFLIVGGICFLFTFVVVWARERIRIFVMNKIIAAMQQTNNVADDIEDQP